MTHDEINDQAARELLDQFAKLGRTAIAGIKSAGSNKMSLGGRIGERIGDISDREWCGHALRRHER